MRRTVMALIALTVAWVLFVLVAVLAIYRAADDPARDGYFDGRGRWYREVRLNDSD